MASAGSMLAGPGGGINLPQVMSPSAQEALLSTPLMNGDRDQLYGAAGIASNGAELSQAEAAGTSQSDLQNPNVFDPAPSPGPLAQMGGDGSTIPDLAAPSGEPHRERGDATFQATPAATSIAPQPSAVALASASQQQHNGPFFVPPQHEGQGSSTRLGELPQQGGTQQSMVRWMTRLTESLRTITTRGVGGTEHVTQSSSHHGVIAGDSNTQQGYMTPMALPAAPSDVMDRLTVNVSPPEELRLRDGPPIPATWSQVTDLQGSPLFSREQIRQLEESQARPSLLRQPPAPSPLPQVSSAGTSTHSSLIQAEVQRQLESYDQRQREQIFKLQQEIFDLRAQRDALDGATFAHNPSARRGQSPSFAAAVGNTVAKASGSIQSGRTT